MSKKFDRHESCPQCGSKDNVGVWDDGQKFCFSRCGYYIPGSSNLSITDLRARLQLIRTKEESKTGAAFLPFDFTLVIPDKPLAWLKQYGITDQERFKHKIGWSEFYESLVLPAFDLYGNILVVQRRYFGTEDFPKYHTKGYPESCLWTVRPRGSENPSVPEDTYNGTLVVVEDYVSAIKVGRQAEVMPLWGSHFSMDKLNKTSDRWSEIVYWLDFNKTSEAVKYRMEAEVFFVKASTVVTPKDPKDYDDREIRTILKDATGGVV